MDLLRGISQTDFRQLVFIFVSFFQRRISGTSSLNICMRAWLKQEHLREVNKKQPQCQAPQQEVSPVVNLGEVAVSTDFGHANLLCETSWCEC